MDRPIIYTQEILRGYDLSEGWKDAYLGLSRAVQDILGQTTAVAAGLAATPTLPTSLVVDLGVGAIYQLAEIDPTSAGDLPADGSTYFLQGVNEAQQAVTLSTSALSSGQKQWALIEAAFEFVDIVRSGDPSGGVLPFYNSANPSVPLNGQGGSGGVLNTERTATVKFKVAYGTPATAGSEVPPSADSGYIGLYLIDLAYGQTAITSGDIIVAGPSVGTGVPSNYPQAPFLAGLLNQHHLGITGQAPKINLATETQGTLPIGNLPVTFSYGTFPGTLTGMTATTPVTMNYVICGYMATIYIADGNDGIGTSNANNMTLTGIPSNLIPATLGAAIKVSGITVGSENGVTGEATYTSSAPAGFDIGLDLVNGSYQQPSYISFPVTGNKGLDAGFCVTFPLK